MSVLFILYFYLTLLKYLYLFILIYKKVQMMKLDSFLIIDKLNVLTRQYLKQQNKRNNQLEI